MRQVYSKHDLLNGILWGPAIKEEDRKEETAYEQLIRDALILAKNGHAEVLREVVRLAKLDKHMDRTLTKWMSPDQLTALLAKNMNEIMSEGTLCERLLKAILDYPHACEVLKANL